MQEVFNRIPSQGGLRVSSKLDTSPGSRVVLQGMPEEMNGLSAIVKAEGKAGVRVRVGRSKLWVDRANISRPRDEVSLRELTAFMHAEMRVDIASPSFAEFKDYVSCLMAFVDMFGDVALIWIWVFEWRTPHYSVYVPAIAILVGSCFAMTSTVTLAQNRRLAYQLSFLQLRQFYETLAFWRLVRKLGADEEAILTTRSSAAPAPGATASASGKSVSKLVFAVARRPLEAVKLSHGLFESAPQATLQLYALVSFGMMGLHLNSCNRFDCRSAGVESNTSWHQACKGTVSECESLSCERFVNESWPEIASNGGLRKEQVHLICAKQTIAQCAPWASIPAWRTCEPKESQAQDCADGSDEIAASCSKTTNRLGIDWRYLITGVSLVTSTGNCAYAISKRRLRLSGQLRHKIAAFGTVSMVWSQLVVRMLFVVSFLCITSSTQRLKFAQAENELGLKVSGFFNKCTVVAAAFVVTMIAERVFARNDLYNGELDVSPVFGNIKAGQQIGRQLLLCVINTFVATDQDLNEAPTSAGARGVLLLNALSMPILALWMYAIEAADPIFVFNTVKLYCLPMLLCVCLQSALRRCQDLNDKAGKTGWVLCQICALSLLVIGNAIICLFSAGGSYGLASSSCETRERFRAMKISQHVDRYVHAGCSASTKLIEAQLYVLLPAACLVAFVVMLLLLHATDNRTTLR